MSDSIKNGGGPAAIGEFYRTRANPHRHRAWGDFTKGDPALPESFPHEGACQGCWAEGLCNVCGEPASRFHRCTNGRCARCHASTCSSGGGDHPGHGFGFPAGTEVMWEEDLGGPESGPSERLHVLTGTVLRTVGDHVEVDEGDEIPRRFPMSHLRIAPRRTP